MVYAGVMNNKHASSILMAQQNTVPLKDSHVYQTIMITWYLCSRDWFLFALFDTLNTTEAVKEQHLSRQQMLLIKKSKLAADVQPTS